MRILLLSLLLIPLTGCVSDTQSEKVGDFGVTRLQVTTPAGMEVRLDLGKEYEAFDGSLRWVDGKPEVSVRARGAKAFEGQAISAAAIAQIQREMTRRFEEGVQITPEIATTIIRGVLGTSIIPRLGLPNTIPVTEEE